MHLRMLLFGDRALSKYQEAGDGKPPSAVKRWKDNWARLTACFSYPPELRRLIYTTKTIESLNRQLSKGRKTRYAFPSDEALLKLLCLAMRDAAKKWTAPMQSWGLMARKKPKVFDFPG